MNLMSEININKEVIFLSTSNKQSHVNPNTIDK